MFTFGRQATKDPSQVGVDDKHEEGGASRHHAYKDHAHIADHRNRGVVSWCRCAKEEVGRGDQDAKPYDENDSSGH